MDVEESLKYWRDAGHVARRTLEAMKLELQPGKTYHEIIESAERFIHRHGGKPAFPATIHSNDLAAHFTTNHLIQGPEGWGGDMVLEKGDCIKIDYGVHIKGHIGDNALTFEVGNTNNHTEQIKAALSYVVETPDVAVYMDAEHFCVKTRGVQDENSSTVTLSVGANSVTTSLGARYSANNGALDYAGTATTLAAIESAIKAAWAQKYGTSGTASGSAIATLIPTHEDGIIQIQMLQVDSGGHDKAVAFSASNPSSSAAVNSSTAANLDWVIGATKSSGDNSTIATANKTGLIVTFESNAAGTDLNAIGSMLDESIGASSTKLSTDYTTNSTWAKTGLPTGTTVERTDIRTAEDSVAAGTSNAVAATVFSRVSWLG